LGVEKLIVTINKMDDNSVEWQEARYDEIVKKMIPFLKQNGYKDDQYMFLPISGLNGDNIKERKGTPAWCKVKTLLTTLDEMATPQRKPEGHLRIPMLDGYKDMGAVTALGKVEQGTVKPGQKCVVMPIGQKCTVVGVYINEEEYTHAICGENVTLTLRGIQEEELRKGYVLCSALGPIPVVTKFKAQMQLVELPDERPVLTSGYKAIIHVHVANEECEILKIYETMVLATKKKEKNPRFALVNSVVTCSILLNRSLALDAFMTTQQLGRFTLRDEGRTIAIGRITELPKEKENEGKKK